MSYSGQRYSASDRTEAWQSFIEGDKDAFSQLYHELFKDLYNYGYYLTGNREESKDNVQELFAYLWEKRDKLPPVSSVKTYLLTALRNRILNKQKAVQKIQAQLKVFSSQLPSSNFSAEHMVVQEEDLTQRSFLISKILNSLPERRKEAIYLRYFRNRSYEEIAQLMGLTEKAVINHIYKGFKALRKCDVLKQVIKVLSFLLLLPSSQ